MSPIIHTSAETTRQPSSTHDAHESGSAPGGGIAVLDRTDEAAAPVENPGWVVLLWNDPVNMVSYVSRCLRRVLEIDKDEADFLVSAVETLGRAPVFHGDLEAAEAIATQLHACELWATLEKS